MSKNKAWEDFQLTTTTVEALKLTREEFFNLGWDSCLESKDQQIKILKEALEFYANEKSWHFLKGGDWKERILNDDIDPYYNLTNKSYSCGGKRARQALKQIEEMSNED